MRRKWWTAWRLRARTSADSLVAGPRVGGLLYNVKGTLPNRVNANTIVTTCVMRMPTCATLGRCAGTGYMAVSG